MRYVILLMSILFSMNADAETESVASSVPVTTSSPNTKRTLVDIVNSYKEGKTTYTEVVGELNKPLTEMSLPGGIKRLTYGGTDSMSVYIPLFGSAKGTSVVLMFDAQDVLTAKTVVQY